LDVRVLSFADRVRASIREGDWFAGPNAITTGLRAAAAPLI